MKGKVYNGLRLITRIGAGSILTAGIIGAAGFFYPHSLAGNPLGWVMAVVMAVMVGVMVALPPLEEADVEIGMDALRAKEAIKSQKREVLPDQGITVLEPPKRQTAVAVDPVA